MNTLKNVLGGGGGGGTEFDTGNEAKETLTLRNKIKQINEIKRQTRNK